MSVITDSFIFKAVTSGGFERFLKPLIILAVVLFMVYISFKPKLENTEGIEL